MTSADLGLLVLRLAYTALLIGFHGWARLLHAYAFAVHGTPWTFVLIVERLGFPFPAVFAVLSALSESIAAIFVAVGVFSRWAALVMVINFSVAFFNEAHKGDPIELPALYLIIALTIVMLGAGRFSFDGRRRKGTPTARRSRAT